MSGYIVIMGDTLSRILQQICKLLLFYFFFLPLSELSVAAVSKPFHSSMTSQHLVKASLTSLNLQSYQPVSYERKKTKLLVMTYQPVSYERKKKKI